MVSFRRFALVLTVLACFAGVVSAQVLPAVPTFSLSIIRSEGVTELLPVLTYTVTNPPEALSLNTYTITAYSSVAITSVTGEPRLTVVDPTNGNVSTPGTVAGTSVTFGNIQITHTTTAITIAGLRVNAADLPSLATGVTGVGANLFLVAAPGSTTAAALFAPGTVPGATTTSSTGTLSYAVPSLRAFTALAPNTILQGTAAASLSICAASPFDPTSTATPVPSFYVTVTELSNFAFRTAAEEALNDTLPTSGTYATNGTEITLTFTNIPANVTLYVPATITNVGLTLTTAAGSAPVAVPASGVVTYTVMADTSALDAASIPVYVNYTGQPALTTKTTLPTVAVALAPLATTTSIPRFNSTPQTSSVTFTESGCTTSLLFPYVVATGGYDTGLSIANTATDPSSSLIGATGACTWYFYGTGAPKDPVVGDQIAPGAISAVVLSAVAPGFQGYAVAQCGFNYAHGYSFVINGNTNATASYLPLVLNRDENNLAESLNN